MGWISLHPLEQRSMPPPTEHVRSAELAGPYGNRVIIDHGSGFSTSYCQMQKCIVKEGQKA
jgi:murein DD-endopeptidase MepM/ murein hydrolase activator NlpD